MICAIHQPNFLPWLGYFDKLRRADVFVFLDDVDYPRKGSGGMGSWSNRVRIDVGGAARWIGCPIVRSTSTGRLGAVRIAEDGRWRGKLLRTLELNYRRYPGFERAMPVLTDILGYENDVLVEFNINAIERLAVSLGIHANMVRQSSLGVAGTATERLVNITRCTGCDTYLCGGGAGGYQDDALFEAAGLVLQYQDYVPAPYAADGTFIAGLSVVDYLMKTTDWF